MFGSVSEQQQNVKHLSKNSIKPFFFFLTHNSKLYQTRKERKINKIQEKKNRCKTYKPVPIVFFKFVYVIETFTISPQEKSPEIC